MRQRKATRMVLHDDMAASITSSQRRANLDAVGFNIGFLLRRRPSLAVEVLKLYDQAHRVREEDPPAPEEDVRLATDEWARFSESASDDLS